MSKIIISELGLGLFALCVALAVLIVSFAANPVPFQTCTVSVDGLVFGNMDLNMETIPQASELSINSIQGSATITAPCNWLRNQGYFV